ncbi:MAG: hypothetical protein RSB61_01295 [Clostridia bacterium]
MKIKLNPLCCILALYFVIIGRVYLFCGYILAIVLHEYAHARVAKMRGYLLNSITIMPYGGVIEGNIGYNRLDNFYIAVAGPVWNFALAIVFVALWWLMPSSYYYTEDFCLANLGLGLVNCLPFYPLDGSRIILSAAKNKLKAIKALKISTIVGGVGLFVLSLISVFYQFNISLGIFGAFLVAGGISNAEKNTFQHVTASAPFNKQYVCGVPEKKVFVTRETQLFRMVSRLNCQEAFVFVVLGDDTRRDFVVDEKLLGEMCMQCELSMTVTQALEKTKTLDKQKELVLKC